VLCAAHAQELQVVQGVELPHHGARQGCQARDGLRVLCCEGLLCGAWPSRGCARCGCTWAAACACLAWQSMRMRMLLIAQSMPQSRVRLGLAAVSGRWALGRRGASPSCEKAPTAPTGGPDAHVKRGLVYLPLCTHDQQPKHALGVVDCQHAVKRAGGVLVQPMHGNAHISTQSRRRDMHYAPCVFGHAL
jgi:hypothetical protein